MSIDPLSLGAGLAKEGLSSKSSSSAQSGDSGDIWTDGATFGDININSASKQSQQTMWIVLGAVAVLWLIKKQ